jgi:hypothetical protein
MTDQGAVWQDIAEKHRDLGVKSSTRAMHDIYQQTGKECAGGLPGRGVTIHRDQRYGNQQDHPQAAGRIEARPQ